MRVTITALILGTFVVGCTLPGGGKFSSEHGYCIQGQIGKDSFKGSGCPTIVPDGANPMGSRKSILPDGTLTEENMFSTIMRSDGTSATGPAADIVAETGRLEQLLLICAVAPLSKACTGS